MSTSDPAQTVDPTRRWLLLGSRAAAYGLDALGYVGIAAAMVPFGLANYALQGAPSRPAVLVVSLLPPVLATVWAARAESGPRQATWGKRRLGIHVSGAAADSGFRHTLLRNAVKILLPWQLGHVVAIGAAHGDFETMRPSTMVATGLLYAIAALFAVLMLRRSGRGPHDLLAGTRVEWNRA